MCIPENTRRWPNVGLMLGHGRRRWANIYPTLGQRLVIAGILLWLRQIHWGIWQKTHYKQWCYWWDKCDWIHWSQFLYAELYTIQRTKMSFGSERVNRFFSASVIMLATSLGQDQTSIGSTSRTFWVSLSPSWQNDIARTLKYSNYFFIFPYMSLNSDNSLSC